MRYSKFIVHSLLLFTLPLSTPQASMPAITMQNPEVAPATPTFSYDAILNLIEDLESGELEKKCSPKDLEKINYYLAYLAQQGLLPNEPDEESILENDIEELLYGDANPYSYSFSYGTGRDAGFAPAILYSQGEVILCGWIGKKWNQTKHFVKKHKKAIIIGTAVVVAAVVIVGIVAATTAAAAAAAGAATADNEGHHSRAKDKSAPTTKPTEPTDVEVAVLKSVIEEHAASFKETIAKEHFFEPCNNLDYQGELPLEENGRALGSLLAHDTFKAMGFPLSNATPQTHGHQEIDRKFATDYTSLYTNPKKEADFNTLSYQLLGERALASGFLNQAVFDLGRAIELDPTSPLPYLERGVAHFGLGKYDHSMQDYHQYAAQTQKIQPLSIPDFSVGFAKGLPQGIYDSGEGIFLFLSDLVQHPVHTGEQTWIALTLLTELARSEQWDLLSEVLTPEVHQLIKDWDTIPSDKRGELAGYAFGKHGSDIIIPGALAKAVSKGLKGAQELSAVYKGLQTAEKTLLLESASGLESGAQIAEVIQSSQKTIALAEDLGFPAQEISQLKKAGTLDGAVADTAAKIAKDPVLNKTAQKFESARNHLAASSGKYMSEMEARNLIHEMGIPTFPRPQGIPENFRIKLSDKPGGMKYVHPTDEGTYVRIMPGKPHSPYPSQRDPYVNHRINGRSLDKFGNIVSNKSPEAHIPLEEFAYRNN